MVVVSLVGFLCRQCRPSGRGSRFVGARRRGAARGAEGERRGDRGHGADRDEGRPDGALAFPAEPGGQQKADPGSEGGAGRHNEAEFRERKIQSFHGGPPPARCKQKARQPFSGRVTGQFAAGAAVFFSIDLSWRPLIPPRTTGVPVTVAGTSAMSLTVSLTEWGVSPKRT